MSDLTVKELVEQSHGLSKQKGWWPELTSLEAAAEESRLEAIEVRLVGSDYLINKTEVRWLVDLVRRQQRHIADLMISEKLMLIVTEVAEAMEEYRAGHHVNAYTSTDKNGNQKPEGMPSELADVLIRIGDLCGRFGIDLSAAVQTKHEYNKTRAFRHGGKKC